MHVESDEDLHSQLQDVALCHTTERLFGALRSSLPNLIGVQDITLFIIDYIDGNKVLHSQGSQERYNLESHLKALFTKCYTSSANPTKSAKMQINSSALMQCLEQLCIVPGRIKMYKLYKVLAAAGVPIQAIKQSESLGYSMQRGQLIDIAKFQQIFEAIATYLHHPLDELLRFSDRNSVNFCTPERKPVNFICTHRHAELADEAKTASSEHKARLGIAVLTATSAMENVIQKNAYGHAWFCPEVDFPQMLLGANDTDEAIARAHRRASLSKGAAGKDGEGADFSTKPKEIALENVCSIPIFALKPDGSLQSPHRVIGVLQACNKRNPNGTISATGFLEADVSRLRILVRTVSIAMQNAADNKIRMKKEMSLRDVIDGYRRSAYLLKCIIDGSGNNERSRNAGIALLPDDPLKWSTGVEKGTEQDDDRNENGKTDEFVAPQSLEESIRNMAGACKEACQATICNISLVIENGHDNVFGSEYAGGVTDNVESRLNNLQSALTSRPFADMPSAGGWVEEQERRTETDGLGLKIWNTHENKNSRSLESTSRLLRRSISSLRRESQSTLELLHRPLVPNCLFLQEQLLALQAREEATVDQPMTLRVYSFYGKSIVSAECLQHTAPVRGVTGAAVQSKWSIRLVHAADHYDFDPLIDSKAGIPTASLLCPCLRQHRQSSRCHHCRQPFLQQASA